MERDEDEVSDQIGRAINSQDKNHGTKWPGMTYEEGVVAALMWLSGQSEEPPMEEE